jgi:hypothetical protein
MVVPTLRVITVHIVSSVILIAWVQSLDAHATRLQKYRLHVSEASKGMIWSEEFHRVAHGDADIWPQLIRSVSVSRFEHVLVDPSSVHQLLVNRVGLVLGRTLGDPEASLEIVSHPLSPLTIGPELLLPLMSYKYSSMRYEFLRGKVLHEAQE